VTKPLNAAPFDSCLEDERRNVLRILLTLASNLAYIITHTTEQKKDKAAHSSAKCRTCNCGEFHTISPVLPVQETLKWIAPPPLRLIAVRA
jgi:hypothetical protein